MSYNGVVTYKCDWCNKVETTLYENKQIYAPYGWNRINGRFEIQSSDGNITQSYNNSKYEYRDKELCEECSKFFLNADFIELIKRLSEAGHKIAS